RGRGGGPPAGSTRDLRPGEPLDRAICLNPLPSPPGAAGGLHWPFRALLHQHVVAEMRKVERAGTRVVLLEPDGPSIVLIGLNPMSRRRVEDVGTAASIEVGSSLRRPALALALAGLGASPA